MVKILREAFRVFNKRGRVWAGGGRNGEMEKGEIYKQLTALTQDFHERVGQLLRKLDESRATGESTREQIEGLKKRAIGTGIVKSAWDLADFLTFLRDGQRVVLFDASKVTFSVNERKSQLNYTVSVKKDVLDIVVRSEKKQHWLPDESIDYVELSIVHDGRTVLALEANLQYGDQIQRSGTKVLGYIPGTWEGGVRELAIGIDVRRKETEAIQRRESERKRLEADSKRFGLDK